jgi:exoribonuclease R
VDAGFDAIRAELEVPERLWDRPDRRDVPLVTLDPAGSRDLDQALGLERRGDGFRVFYAIADVAAWVAPGSELDRLAWEKGVTVYAPDRKTPLYPPPLSEGAGSLLAGEDRAAVLWTMDVDAAGEGALVGVERALVRSREQLAYDTGGERVPLLREVGERLIAARLRAGAVEVDPPGQEVTRAEDGMYALRYEAALPSEAWNAQLSLLTGRLAARVMLDGGVGLLRTMPPPEPDALAAVRRSAAALGTPWPEDVALGAWLRSLPAGSPMRSQATRVLRGAAYTAFDGEPPAETGHWSIAAPYAHVTAPLRRLADRYATEVALALWAGAPVPAWAREALPRLPDAMAAATRRANAVERAIVDQVEARTLAGRVGETFIAVVTNVDDRGAVLQLRDPAVLARLDGEAALGEELRVRLAEVDVAARRVRFVRAT